MIYFGLDLSMYHSGCIVADENKILYNNTIMMPKDSSLHEISESVSDEMSSLIIKYAISTIIIEDFYVGKNRKVALNLALLAGLTLGKLVKKENRIIAVSRQSSLSQLDIKKDIPELPGIKGDKKAKLEPYVAICDKYKIKYGDISLDEADALIAINGYILGACNRVLK